MAADSFDDSIKSEFLQESTEILEEVEGAFLELERTPSDKSIMDHIFRLIHTVKGSSYAVGFNNLGTFAHSFETLLNILREGRLSATTEIIDLLLRSNDVLRQFLEVLKEDYSGDVDCSTVTEELLQAIGDDAPKKWDGPAFGFFEDPVPAPQSPAAAVPVLVGAAAAAKTVMSTPAKVSTSPADAPTVNTVSTQAMNKLPPGIRLVSAVEPVVLICDDEPDMIELVSDMLEMRYGKIKVIQAEDGEIALAKVKDHRPHLIISDLRMPKMNGLDFVQGVREFDKNVPVIFLSGFADRDNMIQFIKLGVTDFFDKPIDGDRLAMSVIQALKISQIREGVARLSSLNFKAYMANLKVRQLHDASPEKQKESGDKAKAVLDEVAALTNYLLTL